MDDSDPEEGEVAEESPVEVAEPWLAVLVAWPDEAMEAEAEDTNFE